MDPETKKQLEERLAGLPAVIQNAIASADIQKQLRAVSDKQQLHVDQWGKLENEVMLTLLGFQEATDLPRNIQNEVGVTAEVASSLASDINTIVFEPIRQELERGLEHPEAKEKEVSDTDAVRTQMLAGESADAASAPAATPDAPAEPAVPGIQPATPAAEKPTEKAVRTPISSSYTSRQASTDRKSVSGDPYRLPPI